MANVKTINVKGKQYAEVSARLMAFREEHPTWSLCSEVLHLAPDYCAIKAVIKNEDGTTIAEGVAMEEHTASGVNSTSFVENCETSAWGRALANLGYGCDGAIASAQELLVALNNTQEQKPAPRVAAVPTAQPQKPVELSEQDKLILAQACDAFAFATNAQDAFYVWNKYKQFQHMKEFQDAKMECKIRLGI